MTAKSLKENEDLILSHLSGSQSERVSQLSALLDEFIVRWIGYTAIATNLVEHDMFEIIELGIRVMEKEIAELRASDLTELRGSWTHFKNMVSNFRKKPSRERVPKLRCAYLDFEKLAFEG